MRDIINGINYLFKNSLYLILKILNNSIDCGSLNMFSILAYNDQEQG